MQRTGMFYTDYQKFETYRLMKNIEGNGEIALNEQFLLFPQYFSFDRIDNLPSILTTSEIVVYKLLQFDDSPKFVV